MTAITAFEGWAILELMGHRRRVGWVQEVEMYGGKMLRIDIPAEDGDITEFYGATSIYALRPVAEAVARDAAARHGDLRPVRPVDYRPLPQLPQVSFTGAADDDDMPF